MKKILLAVLLVSPVVAVAQVPGFKRVELQKHEVGTTGREAVMTRGEFNPGAVVPKHTHPGEEVAYVVEGEITLEIEGKGVQVLKSGDSFFVSAGQVHTARNSGKVLAKVVSTYVVEKGKPLAAMVK